MTKYEVLQNLINCAIQTSNKGVIKNNINQFEDYIKYLKKIQNQLSIEEATEPATDDWIESIDV